jgi:ribulose-phosphate 3-epimerase
VEQKRQVKILPSLLSADFSDIKSEIARMEEAGVDGIHLDIMDGHFVPNLSMGDQVVSAVNRCTDLFLDVHLMMYNPFDSIERFVKAGADRITFHLEATENVQETLDFIRRCNIEAGLAISPSTSETLLLKYLDQCDLVLLMTVNPGFGGQKLIPEVLDKLRFISETVKNLNIERTDKEGNKVPLSIQVDGGVQAETAKQCVEAGANELVSGSFLFKHEDPVKAIAQMLQ